jgi:hypothetical protein
MHQLPETKNPAPVRETGFERTRKSGSGLRKGIGLEEAGATGS